MIVFAKGVTSGYLPLGGVILKERVYQTLRRRRPRLRAAPRLHVLRPSDGVRRRRSPTSTSSSARGWSRAREGALLRRRLERSRRSPIVGEVRTAGLMGAIELVRDKERGALPAGGTVPARIRAAALRRGVIIRASVDTIVVCPPLIITRAQIDAIVRVLRDAIAAVAAEVSATSAPSPDVTHGSRGGGHPRAAPVRPRIPRLTTHASRARPNRSRAGAPAAPGPVLKRPLQAPDAPPAAARQHGGELGAGETASAPSSRPRGARGPPSPPRRRRTPCRRVRGRGR